MRRGRRRWSGMAWIVSIGKPATSVFDHADARREGKETRGKALAKLARTSPAWSGARLEAKAICVARREARRRS
jgi:hypothetical protein